MMFRFFLKNPLGSVYHDSADPDETVINNVSESRFRGEEQFSLWVLVSK